MSTTSAAGSSAQKRTRTTISSGFWSRYQHLLYDKVLPYQWLALNDEIEGAPKSHSIENARIAAGLSDGEYHGMVFQDSDLAKWMEAAGHALRNAQTDPEFPAEQKTLLETRLQEAAKIISAAQQPDGYFNSYFTVKEPDRKWTNLRDAHELYCAGHMIEAAVAVLEGTGDRTLLEFSEKLVDHIASTFGREEGKKRGYPGHQEIELALVKLYRATGERKYFDLAKYFIDERGTQPNYFEIEAKADEYRPIWKLDNHEYRQAHLPVREQRHAVGHSVRAMYQYIAMADIALETGEQELAHACRALWESTTERRMYITGGIGSTRHGEAFTTDYDLPNDTAYAESCASIGLFIFGNRMARLDNDARYMDVAERALYNGVISGLSLDGTEYFYVNPLEVVPEVCDTNGTYEHVKYRRQGWYGCACCPPNIARTIASVGDYAYRVNGNSLYVDVFTSGTVNAQLNAGALSLSQIGDYPWVEDMRFDVTSAPADPVEICIRIPGWCENPSLELNGERVNIDQNLRNGYLVLSRSWSGGDSLELTLPMPVRLVRAHPKVRADYGKVAVARGPLVYCLEECDNGADLHSVSLSADPQFSVSHDDNFLNGVSTITTRGYKMYDGVPGSGDSAGGGDSAGNDADNSAENGGANRPLYSEERSAPATQETRLTFIPYYSWANREAGEMIVWVRQEGNSN